MSSTIQMNVHKNMTAEEKLEEIKYPLENLELLLEALSDMSDDKKLTAILNTIHHQVCEITKAVQA